MPHYSRFPPSGAGVPGVPGLRSMPSTVRARTGYISPDTVEARTGPMHLPGMLSSEAQGQAPGTVPEGTPGIETISMATYKPDQMQLLKSMFGDAIEVDPYTREITITPKQGNGP